MPEKSPNHVLQYVHKLLAGQQHEALPDPELLARFLHKRDEAAFSALLQRHGPMVHNVCQRVLRQAQDVEDAFQATFLILARKARSIRKQQSLGSWLYGVALRVSRKLRGDLARRAARVAEAPVPIPADGMEDLSWREVRGLLDDELERMPERYRQPLILCYLEGLTQDEAAHRLGWTTGALRGRLERARESLRRRLVRRGFTLPAALTALTVAQTTSTAAVPATLQVTTARAAFELATGQTVGASPIIMTLVNGSLKTALFSNFKLMGSLLGLIGVGLTCGWLAISKGDLAKPEHKAGPEFEGDIRPAAGATFATPLAWESRGPGGGGALFAPVFNPQNPDEVFVAGNAGALFHSRDLGRNWKAIEFHRMPVLPRTSVSFAGPKILWSLGSSSADNLSKSRPLRSEDGGATWNALPEAIWPAGRAAASIHTDPAHPELALVVADYRDLYVSRDGGASFALKFRAPTFLHVAGVVFDKAGIYVAAAQDGLLVSRDDGESFVRAEFPGIPEGECIISLAGARNGQTMRLMCVTNDTTGQRVTSQERQKYKAIYALDVGADEGTWQRKTRGIPATGSPFFVAMAQNDIDTAYLAGGYSFPFAGVGVFKTSDGGANWKTVFKAAENDNSEPGWSGGDASPLSRTVCAFGLNVARADKQRVIVTDQIGVRLSTDGGRNWRQIYTTPALETSPATDANAFASRGLESGSGLALAWLDERRMIAGYADILSVHSDDGGHHWAFSNVRRHLDSMCHIVRRPATEQVYAATTAIPDLYVAQADRIDRSPGRVLLSSDAGVNWQTLHDFGMPVVSLAFDPQNPNRLFASVAHTQRGGIYMTNDLHNDAASSWTKLANPPRTEGQPRNVYVLNDGNLACSYASRRAGESVTSSAGFFISTDGGNNWEDRSDPALQVGTQDVVPDPHDRAQNTWYASVSDVKKAKGLAGLYRTRDRGKTWQRLSDPNWPAEKTFSPFSIAIHPASPDIAYITTANDGLWVANNLSAERPTFRPVETFPYRRPLRVFFNPHQPREVWIGTLGNGWCVGVAEN